MSTNQIATFGGGCFWCVEAIFERIEGISDVVSGYSGGTEEHANYQAVCSGRTQHAEVCQITFDPEKIRYEDLVEVFFHTHDPTTPDRQGNDVGPQYRSVIFTHDPSQIETARLVRDRLDGKKTFGSPIVTQILPFEMFYPAEKYHQDYYRLNPNQPYCRAIIDPKVTKFLQWAPKDLTE